MGKEPERESIVVTQPTDIMDSESQRGFRGLFNVSRKFAVLNKLIGNDLINFFIKKQAF